jgi:predicted metal-dependent hydrolase
MQRTAQSAKKCWIDIGGRKIEYTLRKRKKAKSVRLAIYPDGAFAVSAPKWYPMYAIKKFLEEKADWIWEKLKDIDFKKIALKNQLEKKKYASSKELARAIINEWLEFINRHYGFTYNRVSIKNQKSCWGSCSLKRNLNFNYKVAFLPEELRNYVIVHELCHLRELNHGRQFWGLVEKTIPNYIALRKKLKKMDKDTIL